MNRPLKLSLIAAEESGDVLGGALMGALRPLRPSIAFSGVGGRAMSARGLSSPFDTKDLSIIGLASVPRKLPLIFRRIRETADAAIAARPDALIIIDSPDFTHRVARRVRQAAPHIPIVNYAPPTVWAWRPWRAKAMRRYVDEALAILPFEPAAFARLGGPHCTYVGHPLAEQIDRLRPDAAEAQRRMSEPPLLLVLPGSRTSEVRRLTAIFGGITLDLRDARPAPEGASINATAAFGGIDILVPKGWRISVRSTPIFGGLDDRTDRSQPLAADAPTLHVDAVSIFGGVALKHDS